MAEIYDQREALHAARKRDERSESELTGLLACCPFCGGVALLTKPFNSRYRYVACEKCLATGPKSVNEQYAVEWWNKRAG